MAKTAQLRPAFGSTAAQFRPAWSGGGGVAPVAGTAISIWDGSAWVAGELRVFNGTAFVPATLQRWSGSAWEAL